MQGAFKFVYNVTADMQIIAYIVQFWKIPMQLMDLPPKILDIFIFGPKNWLLIQNWVIDTASGPAFLPWKIETFILTRLYWHEILVPTFTISDI